MIPLAEINNMSEKYGVSAEVIEKDYAICWVLNCLSKSKLTHNFIFYGGTAIKRIYFEDHRFSEDIDLCSKNRYSSEALVEELKCLQAARAEANLIFDLNLKNSIFHSGRFQLFIDYSGYEEIVGALKRFELIF